MFVTRTLLPKGAWLMIVIHQRVSYIIHLGHIWLFFPLHCRFWRHEHGLSFLLAFVLAPSVQTHYPSLLRGEGSLYLFGFYSNAAEIPGLL